MKRLNKLDHSLWLVLVAIVLMSVIFIFKVPNLEASGIDLIVWGILSGSMYALINANDKRAVNGRKAVQQIEGGIVVDEDATYQNELNYLAVGSVFTILITWLSLPLLYQIFGRWANYDLSNIERDIITAINLKFSIMILPGVSEILGNALPIVEMGIPYAFIFVGFFTILSTLSTLKIFQSAGLDYYAMLLAMQLVVSVFAGLFLFQEKILIVDAIVMVVLIGLFILTSRWKPKATQDNEKKISSRSWGILFLSSAFLRDLFVRGALIEFDNPQRIFVSFCFRTAYFSTFILIPIGIWVSQVAKAKDLNSVFRKTTFQIDKSSYKKILLPLVTSFILVLVFTLQTPVVATSLAIGPLSLQIGNILVVSFVGLFYKTEGTKPSLLERFGEVFLRQDKGIVRYYYSLTYILFLIVSIIWLVATFYSQ